MRISQSCLDLGARDEQHLAREESSPWGPGHLVLAAGMVLFCSVLFGGIYTVLLFLPPSFLPVVLFNHYKLTMHLGSELVPRKRREGSVECPCGSTPGPRKVMQFACWS